MCRLAVGRPSGAVDECASPSARLQVISPTRGLKTQRHGSTDPLATVRHPWWSVEPCVH